MFYLNKEMYKEASIVQRKAEHVIVQDKPHLLCEGIRRLGQLKKYIGRMVIRVSST